MTKVYALLVCCRHDELTFEVLNDFKDKGLCCYHTVGFNPEKKITNEMKEKADEWSLSFRRLHEAEKVKAWR